MIKLKKIILIFFFKKNLQSITKHTIYLFQIKMCKSLLQPAFRLTNIAKRRTQARLIHVSVKCSYQTYV